MVDLKQLGIASMVALIIALGVALWRLAGVGALGELTRFTPFAVGALALVIGGVLLMSLGQARWMSRLSRRGPHGEDGESHAERSGEQKEK